jgi:hypothetical protein
MGIWELGIRNWELGIKIGVGELVRGWMTITKSPAQSAGLK